MSEGTAITPTTMSADAIAFRRSVSLIAEPGDCTLTHRVALGTDDL